MKILIAEDDPVSSRLLDGFLRKWGYEVVSVSNGLDALALLEADSAPRLAILDWMMPGMEGVAVCRCVRKRKGGAYVYLLLLTARGQKQNMLDGLNAGADDYLSKPFDSEELCARLRAGERILAMQDELIAARDALHEQATHDALTGLMNRGASVQLLTRELARGVREHRAVGIVLADLDHFKKINDNYGHLSGDAALQEVGHRMSKCVRSYDTVARYGGEEFLVLVPSADEISTFRLAERMRRAVESAPVHTSAGEIPITASFGVASCDGTGSLDVTSLLRLADAALYRAKSHGRNCVELSTRVSEPNRSAPSPIV